MNSLVIWSLIPGLAAVILYALRRYARGIYWAGIAISLVLAWLAWVLPIGELVILRLWTTLPGFRIGGSLAVLGGGFSLGETSRPALAMLYLSAAFWFGGAYLARTHRLFVPLGLAIAALMSAALGAEAASTAGLLFALVALLCVPLLSPPGEALRRGILRFLVYQIGGVCLILFADAALASFSASETAPDLLAALLTMTLGFALLLAVVPFHTWMPMLAERGNPYTAVFVFYVIPSSAGFLVFQLLLRLASTGLAPAILAILQYGGVLMVLFGGVGAAFERHLGRIAGFAAISLVGMILLAISLNDTVGRTTVVVGIFFAQLFPAGISLAVWGLALSILQPLLQDLHFRNARAAGRRMPVASVALVMANLSVAGLPLLAGFPVYVSLWTQLGARSLTVTMLSLIGNIGLMIAALRSLAVLMMFPEEREPEPEQAAPVPASEPAATAPTIRLETKKPDRFLPLPGLKISETRVQVLLLAAGIAVLLLGGLFPQAYFPTLTSMAIQFAGAAP